jgi:glyoxylase-like metal-dependent hydrolase (beta-lactamase superfamily II)
MKKRALYLFLTLAVLTAGVVVVQAQDEDIVVVPVAGNIHMLEGSGGNVGVSAGEDGILIVDDKFEKDEAKIRELLKGIDPGPLKFVLNTHFHGDHSGGNAAFGKEAVIIAHENVRVRLSADQPKVALPVVTYEDKISVHFNGEEIELIHLPAGHTDTDSVVYFRGSNVVHMGDLFFSGRFPFIDLGSGGTVQGYLDNIAKVLETLPDDVKLIPGHGPLSAKSDLQEFHTMISECFASVKEHVKAGKTIQDIQAQGVPAAWKDWAWRFISEERWIVMLHTEATK